MERIWLKSYPEGVPADINPTAYASIGDFFAANVERYRDRTAYLSMGRTISHGALDLLSRAFASYLQNVAQLPPGSRVALMMPNLLQYPVAMFGALRAGYVVVNCNPLYSPRELHHQLDDSGGFGVRVRPGEPGDRGIPGNLRRRSLYGTECVDEQRAETYSLKGVPCRTSPIRLAYCNTWARFSSWSCCTISPM